MVHFRFVSLGITFAFLLFSSQLRASVVSNFDTNNEGWTVENGSPSGWSSSGGNPSGYVPYVFVGPAPSIIVSPAKFHGDWRTFNSVSYDHLVGSQGGVVSIFNHRITISGTGGAAYWDGPIVDAADSGWKSFSVSLNENSWIVTSGTWLGLLSDVQFFGIRIELYGNEGGPDIEGIDNVSLNTSPAVPEPSTLAIFGIGVGIAGLKARRRKQTV